MNLTHGQLTLLLNHDPDDSGEAQSALYHRVYSELYRIAGRQMSRERPDHTLQVTGLVHEAYLELVSQADRTWQNRTHFFAYASQVMRHILVRYAKQRMADKRGGQYVQTSLSNISNGCDAPFEMLALDQALKQLEQFDPEKAKIVCLRFLAGLSISELAAVTQRSEPSIYSDLKAAKGWLYHALARKPL